MNSPRTVPWSLVALLVLCGLLLVGTAGAWVRSQSVCDWIARNGFARDRGEEGIHWWLISDSGELILIHHQDSNRQRPPLSVPMDYAWSWTTPRARSAWRLPSAGDIIWQYNWEFAGIGMAAEECQVGNGGAITRMLYIPYRSVMLLWAFSLVFSPMLWLAGYPRRRRRYRAEHGLCVACGYDLRAHRPGQKCPECGTQVPAVAGATGRGNAG
jgi:hypothetical protein